MIDFKVVIMAGGVGERFWPKSRKKLPKQFLSLSGKRSMIQDTVSRLLPLVSIENIYIATGEVYKELVIEQLPDIPIKNIIIEPFAKNTAACIGLAAEHIEHEYSNSVMVILPSDHVVHDEEKFRDTILAGVEIASKGKNIATIGIVPLRPDVGYGYIKSDFNKSLLRGTKVERFVEKPDRTTAESYLEDGTYLWNSGMFIWTTKTFLDNMKEFMPNHYAILSKISIAIGLPNYSDVLSEQYYQLDSISVDYGILEHAKDIYVIHGEFGWDDVGSWNSIERLNPLDECGNVLKGNIKVIESKNCTFDTSNKLVAAIGLENLIIVDTEDVLLVCHKDQSNKIKDILSDLKKDKENSIKYL